MNVHPELDTRLKRAIGQLGTHQDTWVQGDPPLNDAVDEARTALYEAREIIALRQRQHDEHMLRLTKEES